ncbi:MAG: M23 family metallopeptidase [Acidimicrobiales bacterium]
MKSLRFALVAVAVTLAASMSTAQPARAAPTFKAPFPCEQRWTYLHHGAEVRRALDFIRADGGTTEGTPVLASASGRATRHHEAGGAGNYVIIDHGGGWRTYYFHLAGFSAPDGASVGQGEQIGTTGSTGHSSGPHIHYEQLYNGVGQNIAINGQALSYPGSYHQAYLTSGNGCDGPPPPGGGTPFDTWGSGVRVRSDAFLSSPVVTALGGPTAVHVLCQKRGDTVVAEGYTNDWWSRLRDQGGFMSNIYIAHPAYQLPGVPTC